MSTSTLDDDDTAFAVGDTSTGAPDSAAEAARLIASGTKHLVLGHLSQHNNTPALAEQTVEAGLAGFVRGQDYTLRTAAPESDGRMIVF